MSATSNRRGLPPARHDDIALLDLVAAVAGHCEEAGTVRPAARVSQRAFNAARRTADSARGIDPDGPDRTPTANAVVMYFRARSERSLSWADVVSAALASPRQRDQWLVATRRAEPAGWLADRHVAFALKLVASRLGNPVTVTPGDYMTVSEQLRTADVAAHGDHAVLGPLLPTVNQLRTYCDDDWNRALTLAGLQSDPPAGRPDGHSPAPGMPAATAVALYAAINRVWPSYPTMLAFARASGFAMAARPPGAWTAVTDDARAMLEAAGITPPEGNGPRSRGHGKRLTFRYPLNGVPGAYGHGNTRTGERRDALKRELAVISVRAFLADESATGASRAAYVAWRQPADGWAAASRFNWRDIKQQATRANRHDRRRHGTEMPQEARDRAEELKRLLTGPCTKRKEAVPFTEMVGAVLAGPLGEILAPKQG